MEDVAVVVASKAFAQVFCGGVVGYVFYEIADALKTSKIALAATAAATRWGWGCLRINLGELQMLLTAASSMAAALNPGFADRRTN